MRNIRPGDIAGNWLFEVKRATDANGHDVFHATFFWDADKRDHFDGEGHGPTVGQAMVLAVDDATDEG